jgi:sugar/nucleoside kinase (ribokinase family)
VIISSTNLVDVMPLSRRTGTFVQSVVQILAVGDANVEIVLHEIQRLPRFGREEVVPRMVYRAAGSAANFAICAAELGSNTGFAGCLAVDRFSEVVIRAFRDAGVNTQCLRLVEDESTGVTIALIREDGERALITYQGTNTRVTLDNLLSCLKSEAPPRWLHLAGYHLLDQLRGKPAQTLLKIAQDIGITTSLDTGWDPAGWSTETISTLHDTLQFVDVFFPNQAEVRALTEERSPRKGAEQLLELGATAIVVKLGLKGCHVVTKQDQRKIPAFPVDVIDTTAAGDAFNAGFAVSMLSGATLARAAVFANAVAALRISRSPNQSLFPNLQETTAFLMRQRPLET